MTPVTLPTADELFGGSRLEPVLLLGRPTADRAPDLALEHAVADCLDYRDAALVYREMAQVALAQLAEATATITRLTAANRRQSEVIREYVEPRRPMVRRAA